MSKEKAPGQLVFPAKISDVDGFIESLLEPTAPTFAMNGSGRCP